MAGDDRPPGPAAGDVTSAFSAAVGTPGASLRPAPGAGRHRRHQLPPLPLSPFRLSRARPFSPLSPSWSPPRWSPSRARPASAYPYPDVTLQVHGFGGGAGMGQWGALGYALTGTTDTAILEHYYGTLSAGGTTTVGTSASFNDAHHTSTWP